VKKFLFAVPDRISVLHHLSILTVSAFAGHFIVVHNTSKSWFELITNAYYYQSVFYSMLIAAMLIEFVFWITIWMNRKDGGFRLTKKKIMETSHLRIWACLIPGNLPGSAAVLGEYRAYGIGTLFC